MQYSESYAGRRQRLKSFARMGLRGRILSSFAACLIPGLITWGLRLFPSDLLVVHLLVFDQIVISISLLMVLVSAAASFLVAGPLDAGLAGYFTRLLTDRKNPPSALSVCDCFGAGYPRLVFGMFAYRAVVFLAVAVPLSLLLLPGMLTREAVEGMEVFRVATAVWPIALVAFALFAYLETALSMVPYLLINDASLSAQDVLFESVRLTRGHVVELLIMQFSFLLWLSLAAVSLFIGMLYVYPYMQATYAAYYLELSNLGRRVEGEVEGEEESRED
jgi:hypothetical protein